MANAGGLETQAKDIRSQGAKIAKTATTIDTEWRKLAAHFKSPDTATLTAALKPAITDGDSVKTDADTVAKALEAYAKTERSLQAQKTALLTDIANFDSSIAGDDEWRKDEDKVKAQQALLGRMNQLVRDHTDAENDCANAINAIYGGVQYRQEDGSGKALAPGEEINGYTKEVLDSASGAGQTPWGKPAEWDKPWYRDVWDGAKAFGSGLWESIKGTVTGLKALANPFDWKTFSSTWKGVGTLALDVAVATSPVATVLMPERAAESRQRLKTVGSALLNVEEWKRNPAKAAGTLTGDVLQTLVPGAGGARAAAMAGKAGKVVGRAGQIASKLGVSERVVVGTTNATMKTINTVAFKIDDVGYAVREAKFKVTDPVMDRVIPQADRARATMTRMRHQVTPHVRAVGDMLVEPWERKPARSVGLPRNSGGTVAAHPNDFFEVPRFGPERDYQTLLRARMSETPSSSGSGSGPGGRGSGGPGVGPSDPRYVPKTGEVLLRPRSKWDPPQQAEFTKKVDGLNDAVEKTGDVSFIDKKGMAPRVESRASVMNKFSQDAYDARRLHGSADGEMNRMKVPADVQRRIESAVVDAEQGRVGGLTKSEYEGILRRELKQYDLDHTRDLQVGGTDDYRENMQWLDHSVNRSVGAQLRNQGRRQINPFVKSANFDEPGEGTQITDFVVGASR